MVECLVPVFHFTCLSLPLVGLVIKQLKIGISSTSRNKYRLHVNNEYDETFENQYQDLNLADVFFSSDLYVIEIL